MIPGAEAIGIILIIMFVMICLGLVGIAALTLGFLLIFRFKKKKAGCWIAGAGSCILITLLIVWRVMNPPPKEFAVSIDLRNPLDKSGIPADVGWLKDSKYFEGNDGKYHPDNYWICHAQGKVSLKVILPDGKIIEETVYSLIADYRSANGFYDLQIDGLEEFNREQAITKFSSEAQKWSVGALNSTNLSSQIENIRIWIAEGEPGAMGSSQFNGLYFCLTDYTISTQAVRDLLDGGKFKWRYNITTASALPKPRKK